MARVYEENAMPCLTCRELSSSLQTASAPDQANGLSPAGERNRAQQKQERLQKIQASMLKHQLICPEAQKEVAVETT